MNAILLQYLRDEKYNFSLPMHVFIEPRRVEVWDVLQRYEGVGYIEPGHPSLAFALWYMVWTFRGFGFWEYESFDSLAWCSLLLPFFPLPILCFLALFFCLKHNTQAYIHICTLTLWIIWQILRLTKLLVTCNDIPVKKNHKSCSSTIDGGKKYYLSAFSFWHLQHMHHEIKLWE